VTKQTRVLVITRRDGAIRAHFIVGTPRNIRDIASVFLLELHPGLPPSRPRGACSEVPYAKMHNIAHPLGTRRIGEQ
jgi:hypothetical protein